MRVVLIHRIDPVNRDRPPPLDRAVTGRREAVVIGMYSMSSAM